MQLFFMKVVDWELEVNQGHRKCHHSFK